MFLLAGVIAGLPCEADYIVGLTSWPGTGHLWSRTCAEPHWGASQSEPRTVSVNR